MKNKEIAHYGNEELWERLSLSEANRERIEQTIKMIQKGLIQSQILVVVVGSF